jgi:hypothetical protein
LSPDDIKALNDFELELAFEKNKKIALDTISRQKLGSAERIAAEKEYYDLVRQYEEERYKKKKENEENFWKTVNKAAGIAEDISGKIFEFQRQEAQSRAESELESIDTIYGARLKAAEGNAVETERIEQEYRAAKEAAEKRAAEERRKIAIKEAIIATALAILKVAPNIALMAVAAITGGIQLATISRQKFARGGFTGKGFGLPDETGEIPVGIVHADEYVANKRQVRKYPALFQALEKDRLNKFAEGGFTSGGLGASVGFGADQMVAMAEIIAERVAREVASATYQGTSKGAEMGSNKGILGANREIGSRNNALKLNTY